MKSALSVYNELQTLKARVEALEKIIEQIGKQDMRPILHRKSKIEKAEHAAA